MTPTRLRGHVRALDGVRAFAVMIVLLAHAFPQYAFPGGVGVDVFFVLSGYLITTLLVQERERFGSVRVGAFYLRRLLRLYPALLALVAVLCLVARYGAGSFTAYTRHAAAALAYISNLIMGYGHDYLDPLSHTWSLAQEEQFYLLWPTVLLGALALGVTRRWLVALLLAGAVVSWVFFVAAGTDEFAGFQPGVRCGGLLVGCALALTLNARTPRWLRSGSAVAAAVVLPVILAAGWLLGPRSFQGVVIGTVVASAVLIGSIVVAPAAVVARSLAARPVAYVGRISYALYLWHYPIMLMLQRHSGYSTRMLFVPELVLSFAAAAASYRLVERPALRLKGRFEPAAVRFQPSSPAVRAEAESAPSTLS